MSISAQFAFGSFSPFVFSLSLFLFMSFAMVIFKFNLIKLLGVFQKWDSLSLFFNYCLLVLFGRC